ncbi:MAG: DUF4340 domain-containing protein [Sphingobacteriales bacterium]|nr:MAG: DUF4340 domain-containing protein [Sphingobacteriales bacterium]
MRKTILYIIILGILGFGVYYFIFSNQQAFATDEAGFTIPDTASIGKIYMADKAGNTVLLERKDNGWLLDKAYPVIPQHLNTLLTTLATQIPQHPVAEEQHDFAIKNMATEGIKVEIYDNSGKKMRTFYVGGQVQAQAGTYMLMENAERPYVVHIPGMYGYLTPRYSTDAKLWRDRNVVNVQAEDLKLVSINYLSEPLNSFTLVQDDKGDLSVTVDSGLSNGKALNVNRTKAYTRFFTNINSEAILNGNVGLNDLFKMLNKRLILDVVNKKGKKQHVEVYWMPSNRRSKNQLTPDPNIPDGYDADRFYATLNDYKDTVLIQRNTFDKLFRKGYEFYQADAQPGFKIDTVVNTIKMKQ